jgi:hypothetical protein
MSRKSSIKKVKRDNTSSNNISALLSMYLYEKQHSPITTRFQGCGLSECDVISMSKSDYIYEYEIKISRSDFKADFKKQKHSMILEKQFINESYSDNLNCYTPNYFYFVVTENLVSVDEVPYYAGLIYVKENGVLDTIKKAPLLHKTKATPNFIRQLSHNLTCKLVFNRIK